MMSEKTPDELRNTIKLKDAEINDMVAMLGKRYTRITELEDRIESTMGALGIPYDPLVDFDMAQAISDIRDEGRNYFHAVTNLTAENSRLDSLAAADAQALVEVCEERNRLDKKVADLTTKNARLREMVDAINKRLKNVYPTQRNVDEMGDAIYAVFDLILPHIQAAEREEQRRNFAHGNTTIDNPNITREDIDEAADKLAAEQAKQEGGER